MEKIVLKIKGMHCAACAINIEKTLLKKRGIISANVNFSLERAKLEYDPKKIDKKEIINLIEKIGYKVVKKEGKLKKEIKKRWLIFWLGLILTLLQPDFFTIGLDSYSGLKLQQ